MEYCTLQPLFVQHQFEKIMLSHLKIKRLEGLWFMGRLPTCLACCRYATSFASISWYNLRHAHSYLTAIGNEDLAKQHAARLRSFFEGDVNYKERKPCTTVDLLVDELKNPERYL